VYVIMPPPRFFQFSSSLLSCSSFPHEFNVAEGSVRCATCLTHAKPKRLSWTNCFAPIHWGWSSRRIDGGSMLHPCLSTPSRPSHSKLLGRRHSNVHTDPHTPGADIRYQMTHCSGYPGFGPNQCRNPSPSARSCCWPASSSVGTGWPTENG
jgi:hypothetical protein